VVLLDEGVDREQLRRRLRERHGVALSGGVYDTLVPDQPYFADRPESGGTRRRVGEQRRRYPRAEWFASRHVCLPLFNEMSERQQQAVVDALRTELG
jgi:dTDP-4-amino-4,6-dideoxygalactose transaminase